MDITTYRSFGPIEIGMLRDRVRAIAGAYKEFFRGKPAPGDVPTDIFQDHSIFVYYDSNYRVEFIEVAKPQRAIFNGKDLFAMSFDDAVAFLKSSDPAVDVDQDGLTSKLLGIAIYSPASPEEARDEIGNIESVSVFKEGYFD